ncbi:MAG: hypothetical protein LBL98_08090 [Ruminococcus sp.]|nr:hypothetical protein [Ruminococcus sp.]
MKELNILTSTDNNLVRHLFTQLKNIADNLLEYEVNFWLFHYRIPKADILELKAYSEFLGIKFHEVYVDDFEDYNVLTKGADDKYPYEAYFYFLAHKYLPESIERALYIDAGDIIFDGDIEEFYCAPFEGNFIIATMGFSNRAELYTFNDITDTALTPYIGSEYLNSGSVLLNLQLMRIFNIDFRFYENVVNYIIANTVRFTTENFTSPIHYCYDQGLLAMTFAGRIKFFDYEYFGFQALHMPYNFKPFYFEYNKERLKFNEDGEVKLPYEPHIIHLIGNKPWSTDKETYEKLLPVSRKYLDIFWKAEAEAKRWRREYSERN